jgi:hypothetical protein
VFHHERPPHEKGNTNTLKERTRMAGASVTKHKDEWNVTTIAGRNNINKKDTYIIRTNGRRPKKGRVLKIKIIIILMTIF